MSFPHVAVWVEDKEAAASVGGVLTAIVHREGRMGIEWGSGKTGPHKNRLGADTDTSVRHLALFECKRIPSFPPGSLPNFSISARLIPLPPRRRQPFRRSSFTPVFLSPLRNRAPPFVGLGGPFFPPGIRHTFRFLFQLEDPRSAVLLRRLRRRKLDAASSSPPLFSFLYCAPLPLPPPSGAWLSTFRREDKTRLALYTVTTGERKAPPPPPPPLPPSLGPQTFQ